MDGVNESRSGSGQNGRNPAKAPDKPSTGGGILLERVQRLGFEHLAISRLQWPPSRLYSSVDGKGRRNGAYSSALEDLQAILDPKNGVLGSINRHLRTYQKKSRQKPLNEDEFWICFGVWIASQLIRSSGVKADVKTTLVEAEEQLKSLIPNDRFESIRAGFDLKEPTLRKALAASFDSLITLINVGYLLVVDETISATTSRKASEDGMVRFIPGKPHPKGYFCNMILSKLLKTKLPLVLDVEFKWSFESLSMSTAALALTKRTEERFGRDFGLILDSGYPAGTLLGHPHEDIKSKQIVSCSISKVSGEFRHLVEAASVCFVVGEKTLLWRPADHIVAFIHKKRKYTQVLTTNACGILDAPPLERALHPMSWQQASAIAENFSVDQMTAAFGWPAPSPDETPTKGVYPLEYVSHITGVDLTTPLDANFYVSETSLSALPLPSLKAVAEHWRCSKTGYKKKDYIQAVLRVHPKAKPTEPLTDSASKKRRRNSDAASGERARSLERDADTLAEHLLSHEPRPDFADMYTNNYGLEDRVNAVLYRFFDQTGSVTPGSRYTWIFFYICLINTYVLRAERAANKEEKDQKNPDDESLFAHFPDFILQILQEIATEYS